MNTQDVVDLARAMLADKAASLSASSLTKRFEAAVAVRFALEREIVSQREPDFQIVRGSDKEVYLRRWWVVPRNAEFNVYLHNMLHDDDPVLHDHMYESWSLCLGGVLREVHQENPPDGERTERLVRVGDVTVRSERMAHQLIVAKPAWTLFVTGPRVKEWGFWCPKGFRHWSKYVASDQDPSVQGNGANGSSGVGGVGGVGIGCGEQS